MIDFSTLQGLAIPEGNVTQITDASGRVIWALASDLPGTFYLRPSADISVDDTIDHYPSSGYYPYMLINEEVADDDATYIKLSCTPGESKTAYAEFELSGFPQQRVTKINSILGGRRYFSTHNFANNAKRNASVSLYLCIDGEEYVGFAGNAYEDVNNWTTYETEFNGALSAINDYITANGKLPNMTLKLRMDVVDGTENGSKSEVWVNVSQAYVVIECE